jgi:hypothetical protein
VTDARLFCFPRPTNQRRIVFLVPYRYSTNQPSIIFFSFVPSHPRWTPPRCRRANLILSFFFFAPVPVLPTTSASTCTPVAGTSTQRSGLQLYAVSTLVDTKPSVLSGEETYPRSLSQEKVGGIVSIKEFKLVVLYLQKCANLDSVPRWRTRWWYCIDQIVQSWYCIYGSVGTSIRFLVGEISKFADTSCYVAKKCQSVSDGSEGSLRECVVSTVLSVGVWVHVAGY